MPDSLSIAIGTVLTSLELVEAKHGHIENVHLYSLMGEPTNVIEFSMNNRTYEVLVTEMSRKAQHQKAGDKKAGDKKDRKNHAAPSTTRVSLRSRMTTESDGKTSGRKSSSTQLTIPSKV